MHKLPLAFYEQGFEVVIWIASFVSQRSVSDFQIHDFLSCFVYQAVSVTCACLEAGTHSRRELGSSFVGVQRRPTLEDIDELILLGVSVSKG